MRRKNLAYSADGTPRYIRVYDNGGETVDRYFCQFTRRNGEGFPHLMMSADPFHPQGVGQHGDAGDRPLPYDRPRSSHLGRRVTWDKLPEAVQQCIMQDYIEYWGEFVAPKGEEVFV